MKKQWILSIASIGIFACLGEAGFAQEIPAIEGDQEVVSVSTLEFTLLSEEDPDPTDPTNPVDPVEPTDPTIPEEPGEPGGPTDPVDPVDPIDPTEPIEPEEPTDPINPVDPEKPIEPEVPVDPVEPETPPTPEKPTEPTPTEPNVPEAPVTTPSVEQPILTDSGREIVGVENSVPIVKEANGSYTPLAATDYTIQADGTVQVKTKEGLKVLPKTGEAHQQGLSMLGVLVASLPVFVFFKKRSRHEETA